MKTNGHVLYRKAVARGQGSFRSSPAWHLRAPACDWCRRSGDRCWQVIAHTQKERRLLVFLHSRHSFIRTIGPALPLSLSCVCRRGIACARLARRVCYVCVCLRLRGCPPVRACVRGCLARWLAPPRALTYKEARDTIIASECDSLSSCRRSEGTTRFRSRQDHERVDNESAVP